MKKNYSLRILLLASFLLFFTVPAQAKNGAVDIRFARELAVRAIDADSNEWKRIDEQIASMKTTDLAALKKSLLEVLAQDPPVTTSIAGIWLVYNIIYKIDDILGTLEYSKIVEGKFNWDRATSLLGATELDFITNKGRRLSILATVATVDKDSVYLTSAGRNVRLYIKEETLAGGKKRNQVVKIELRR